MTLTLKLPTPVAEQALIEWSPIAKCALNVEIIENTVYGFTSNELGALRLFYHYNRLTNTGKARMGYSENLKTWFFALDI